MKHPVAWKRYVENIERGESVDPGLARFDSRYGLAKGFEKVLINDVSEAARDGFSAGLSASLSYSALEALNKAVPRQHQATTLESETLAAAYRATHMDKLRNLLATTTHSEALVDRLAKLSSDPSEIDLMPVAKAIRHSVFHADFTPYGSGAATNKATLDFLTGLSEALLDEADSAFELYLDRLAIGPWDAGYLASCPSCGVSTGSKHNRGCDIARCKTHGEQRNFCFGESRHGMTTYWGVYPGTVEALKRGWGVGRGSDKRPDLNRVMAELSWDPRTEQFV